MTRLLCRCGLDPQSINLHPCEHRRGHGSGTQVRDVEEESGIARMGVKYAASPIKTLASSSYIYSMQQL